MNKTVIIACKTLHLEIEAAFNQVGYTLPCIWVDSGLHDNPKKLHDALQGILNDITDTKRVLLAFGSCGNATAGLKTGNFELIILRVDDCITAFLGSAENKKKFERTYFLTKGYIEGVRNIWEEYKYTINKYGVELGKEIFATMLKNYKILGVLDTGGYRIESISDITDQIANELELEKRIIPASISYIADLISGPWDEKRFVRVPPYSEVKFSV